MLHFASANQQCIAEFCDDFEFMMPNEPSSNDQSFSETENCYLSPADELFYRGQILPLLLPCRLKMVQELCASETRASIATSKEEDADPHANKFPNNPSLSASCSREVPAKVLSFSPNYLRHPPSQKRDNPEELMHHSHRNQPNARIATLKPRLKWKLLFRKGKNCPMIEAACCHYTSSKNGIRNKASEEDHISIKSYTSAFCRSGSCRGSPKRPRRTLSSLSSSALIRRNGSRKSRSFRDKGSNSAIRVLTLTAKAQKESLVLKARDCFQKSLQVLKLASPNKGNLLKQQHDYQCLQGTNVAKKRSQVAHCEQKNSISNRFEGENACSDITARSKSLWSPKPKEDMGYWDLHLAESERDLADSLLQVNNQEVEDDDDEHFDAAFITIEPAFPEKAQSECNPSPDLHCKASSCLTFESPSGNSRAASLDLHDSIQGAIAHCKASA